MDQVTTVRKHMKCEQWKSIITECRSSGMTVTAWCKANGICEQTYYRNLKKLLTKYPKKTWDVLLSQHLEQKVLVPQFLPHVVDIELKIIPME